MIIRDKLLQFPGKRMEAVISPKFMARGDDKEEIWAGVKVSNKCSTASPNMVGMEMSALFCRQMAARDARRLPNTAAP